MTSSMLAPPVANAQNISSGANCEAANLNQALQGMGWSQAGLKNNAAIPLFVVCPLQSVITVATRVFAFGIFPAVGGTIECNYRSENFLTGAYLNTAFTITGGLPAALAITRGYVVEGVTSDGFNNTIVCALDPGEGIEWFAIS